MTNKERYQQAFSVLHSSGQFTLEVEDMEQIQKKHRKNMAAAAAIVSAVIIGTGGTVYAADIGGIQQKITMWLHGAQTEADVTSNGDNGYGGYTFSFTQDGETEKIGGGGVSIGADGSETWLSADEVAAEMSRSAGIDVDENGRVWIYYYDQKIDITDCFDENGVYNLTLSHEDETISLEITKDSDGGYSFTQTTIPADTYENQSRSGKEYPLTDDAEPYRETGEEAPPEKADESDASAITKTYIGITDGN